MTRSNRQFVQAATPYAGGVDEVESTMLRWARELWESWPDADRTTVRNLTVELVPERWFRH